MFAYQLWDIFSIWKRSILIGLCKMTKNFCHLPVDRKITETEIAISEPKSSP